MRHDESELQRKCVKWFRLQYPQFARLLFSVPNGGARNRVEAAIMKGEGTVAGVADLLLLLPSYSRDEASRHGLAIEMKTPKGRQSPEQKEWQKEIEDWGYGYVVCRSLDDFMRKVNDYLKED
ncbi:MAG: VRR-NUC domain-containing protein [Bacteroidales bacterium]|nr:VRR-NUC domain-containing protein [Bacteroidales bacterium]